MPDQNAHLDDQEVWRPFLDPGERLLWSGRPWLRIGLFPGDWIAIPVSLLVGLIGTAAVLSFLSGGEAAETTFAGIWGLICIAGAVYLLVWRYVRRYLVRRRTWYAVTTQRALILRKGRHDRLRELPIGPYLPVEVEFGQRGQVWLGWRPTDNDAQQAAITGSEPAGFQFVGIADVGNVHDLIRGLRRGDYA